MTNRTLYRYRVQVKGPGGITQEERFETYWSPERTTEDQLLQAASAQFTGLATRGRGAPVQWQAVSIERIEPRFEP